MAKYFVSIGHSSSDPGAVANGTTEYKELNKILPGAVKMARPHLNAGDKIVVVPPAYDYVEAVQYFLKHADRSTDIFTEVHLNSNAGAPGSGTETWYGGLKAFAKNLNSSFVRGMRRQFPGWKNRGLKYSTKFYITRKLSNDGNILELGFLNNGNDLSRLRKQGTRALAEALVSVSHGEPTPLPKKQQEEEPDKDSKSEEKPAAGADGINYKKYKQPVRAVVSTDKAPLWDFSAATWGDFEKVDTFPKGEVLVMAGEAQHPLGGVYLMTEYSFGQAGKTGAPHKTWGMNAADLKMVDVQDDGDADSDESDESGAENGFQLERLPEPHTVPLRRDAHVVAPDDGFTSVKMLKEGSDFRKYATFETDRKYYVTEKNYGAWKKGGEFLAIEADALEYPSDKQIKDIEKRLGAVETLLDKVVRFIRSVFKGFK